MKRKSDSQTAGGESVGQCPICLRTKRLVGDHCHAEGEQRERICGTCNSGLGMLCDDPEVIRRAADYVEKWRALMADDELLQFARSKAYEASKLHPRA